jgi:uncharacterized membrane protein
MMEPTRVSVWRRMALPASLILNCFLAAWIAGHAWHTRDEQVARILANIERNLDPKDTAAFRRVVQREGPQLAASAGRIAATRRLLKQRLMAEPYDQAAARQALTAWHTSVDQFLDEFGGTLIDALAQVSPEGRRRVVENRADP